MERKQKKGRMKGKERKNRREEGRGKDKKRKGNEQVLYIARFFSSAQCFGASTYPSALLC